MARFLMTRFVNDEEDGGFFQAVVYPSLSGKLRVEEPTGVFSCSHGHICSGRRLSKCQSNRVYSNLTKLFGQIDPSINYLRLSSLIYKSDLSEEEVLNAIIADDEDDEDIFYISTRD